MPPQIGGEHSARGRAPDWSDRDVLPLEHRA